MIDKLRQQIENQSLQIANLTFQMHHLNKNVLAKLNQNGGSANEAAASNLKPLSPKLLKSSSNSHRPSLIQTSSSSSSLHVAKESQINSLYQSFNSSSYNHDNFYVLIGLMRLLMVGFRLFFISVFNSFTCNLNCYFHVTIM